MNSQSKESGRDVISLLTLKESAPLIIGVTEKLFQKTIINKTPILKYDNKLKIKLKVLISIEICVRIMSAEIITWLKTFENVEKQTLKKTT